MPIQSVHVKIEGISPLLTNNPQTVDRFNKYTRRMAEINAKKTRRTDDDYMELRDIEMESKTYYDETVGLYVPGTWLSASFAKHSFAVCKVSKDAVRGAVLTTEDKLPLQCRYRNKVKGLADIVKNPAFRHMMTLKQGQVRVVKAMPIFHDWSFQTVMEFDDKIIDPDSMRRVLEHAAKYGGFGDFRPTFGRAVAEVSNV
jgi:hypothetical protein